MKSAKCGYNLTANELFLLSCIYRPYIMKAKKKKKKKDIQEELFSNRTISQFHKR